MYGSGPDFGKPLPSYTGQVDENGVYNGTLDNPPRFFEGINPNDKYFFKDNECYTNANPNKDGTWGPCTPCEGNIGGTNGVEKGGSPKTDGVKGPGGNAPGTDSSGNTPAPNPGSSPSYGERVIKNFHKTSGLSLFSLTSIYKVTPRKILGFVLGSSVIAGNVTVKYTGGVTWSKVAWSAVTAGVWGELPIYASQLPKLAAYATVNSGIGALAVATGWFPGTFIGSAISEIPCEDGLTFSENIGTVFFEGRVNFK